MKRINLKYFLISIIVCCVFCFFSFISFAAVDEGSGHHNFITQLFARLFPIFRFPTHDLFYDFLSENNFYIFLFINCLFYAFIVERLISLTSPRTHSHATHHAHQVNHRSAANAAPKAVKESR